MNKESETIIENIKALIEEHKKFKTKRDDLLLEQESVLDNLLEKYKPVYQWIRNETRYIFTHPTLNYQSNNGPILGYHEKDNKLIIYNVNEHLIEIIDIGKKTEKETIVSIRYLVENGYFSTAVDGLKFLEDMFKSYLDNTSQLIVQLNNALENAK